MYLLFWNLEIFVLKICILYERHSKFEKKIDFLECISLFEKKETHLRIKEESPNFELK